MKKIREQEHYNLCPIAAVTANVLKNTRENLLNSGFTHYLPKPYTRDQLISLSQEMLNLNTKTARENERIINKI